MNLVALGQIAANERLTIADWWAAAFGITPSLAISCSWECPTRIQSTSLAVASKVAPMSTLPVPKTISQNLGNMAKKTYAALSLFFSTKGIKEHVRVGSKEC
jgi:hypothetical protein